MFENLVNYDISQTIFPEHYGTVTVWEPCKLWYKSNYKMGEHRSCGVWEPCKLWYKSNYNCSNKITRMFENLVNYDISQTELIESMDANEFENLVNYDISQTCFLIRKRRNQFENLVNYDISQTSPTRYKR